MYKQYFIVFTIIFFAIITIPLTSTKVENKKIKHTTTKIYVSTSKNLSQKETVKIYMKDTKTIEQILLSEYLLGVVLTEMDDTYEDEALKAQAVAAHTLLEFRKTENKDKKYHITDDYSIDQGYMNKQKRKTKYGNDLEKLEKRVKPLINQVKDDVIYYNNKPILAVYHDTSGGKTENCQDIWGGNYPYLVSVDSISDLLNPNYLSTISYTKAEFKTKLKTLNTTLPKKLDNYIGEIKTTNSGTVKSIVLGKKIFTGTEIRKAFSLRSANFDLKIQDKKFTFTVRGYGHGVGMSQYGAKSMAKEGSDYITILKHYYTGVEIKG